MGKTRKREIRRQFRDAVFKRDGYRCVVCGFQSSPERAEDEMDAHHVTPREEMPNGGYVRENGVTLCDPTKTGGQPSESCHWRAEWVLQNPGPYVKFGRYTPEALYQVIGSSREQATAASERLR